MSACGTEREFRAHSRSIPASFVFKSIAPDFDRGCFGLSPDAFILICGHRRMET